MERASKSEETRQPKHQRKSPAVERGQCGSVGGLLEAPRYYVDRTAEEFGPFLTGKMTGGPAGSAYS